MRTGNKNAINLGVQPLQHMIDQPPSAQDEFALVGAAHAPPAAA
jgi:hypothetical protein